MLSRARVLQLRADYQAGMSLTDMQRKYGHSVLTIRRWVCDERPLPKSRPKKSGLSAQLTPEAHEPATLWVQSLPPGPAQALLTQAARYLDQKYSWKVLKRARPKLVSELASELKVAPALAQALVALLVEGLARVKAPEDQVAWGTLRLDLRPITLKTPTGTLKQCLLTLCLPQVPLTLGYVLPGPSFEGIVEALQELSAHLQGLPQKLELAAVEFEPLITRPLREHETVLGQGNSLVTRDHQGQACAFTTDFMNFKLALGAEVTLGASGATGADWCVLTVLASDLVYRGDAAAFNEELHTLLLQAQGLSGADFAELMALVAAGKHPQEGAKEALQAWLKAHAPRTPQLGRALHALAPLNARVTDFPRTSVHQAEVNQFGRISFEGNEYSVPNMRPGAAVVVVVDKFKLSVRTARNKELICFDRCYGQGHYLLIWELELERLIAQPAAFGRSRVAFKFNSEDVSLVVSCGFAAVSAVLTALKARLEDNDIARLAQLFHLCVRKAQDMADEDDFSTVLVNLIAQEPAN